MSYRLLVVFGTRPEAIKMAPLVAELSKIEAIEPAICVTAQHREMLDQVLEIFELSPDVDLDIMTPGQSLQETTARVMLEVSTVIARLAPQRVLVQGDTTTAMAAAMAAFYHHVPVDHIEAGLRTSSIWAPWPEEMNRRVISVMADQHFAPTERARERLLKENIPDAAIAVTGNTGIDALLMTLERIENDSELERRLASRFGFLSPRKKLVLVTMHRRETQGETMEGLCKALELLAARDDVQIVFPVHPNPNVTRVVNRHLQSVENIFLLPPQDYVEFVYLMGRSYLILTDSGGIQEEAPSLDKPVLVMREVTERIEAIEAGTARLVGTNGAAILTSAAELLDDSKAYRAMSRPDNPYGDGRAAARIARIIRSTLNGQS